MYDQAHKQYLITVNAREVEGSDNATHRDTFSRLTSEIENVNYINYNDGLVSINMQHIKNMDVENLITVLKKVTSYCQLEGFRHTCRYCETENGLDFYTIQGDIACICPECAAKISQAHNDKASKKENYIAGIGGAILGALIGAVVWVIAYQAGFIVAIAGYLMVFCAVRGYVMFSGNLSKKGLWTSILISVLVLCFSECICLAIEIMRAFDVSFFNAFQSVFMFLEDPDIMAIVLKDVGLGLVFMVVASFSFVKSLHKGVTKSFEFERLN